MVELSGFALKEYAEYLLLNNGKVENFIVNPTADCLHNLSINHLAVILNISCPELEKKLLLVLQFLLTGI